MGYTMHTSHSSLIITSLIITGFCLVVLYVHVDSRYSPHYLGVWSVELHGHESTCAGVVILQL